MLVFRVFRNEIMIASSVEKGRESISPGAEITTSRVLLALALLFVVNLLLRVFYLRYDFVNGDEGVRALSAVKMLQGARLYVDVVTDKPPGTTLFYAATLSIFGHSMKAVHLAATVWNYLASVLVFGIGSLVFSRRVGLWAAFMFAYFTTNYFTQDTMAANTELLMTLPYAGAFFAYVLSLDLPRTRLASETLLLFLSGFLTAAAVLFKQVGALNLLFFAVFEASVLLGEAEGSAGASLGRALRRLGTILCGMVVVLLAGYGFLLAAAADREFWRYTVQLNLSYLESEPLASQIHFLLTRGLSYLLFNAALFTPAAFYVTKIMADRRKRSQSGVHSPSHQPNQNRMRRAIALWCAFTLAAVLLGGRFFGHYFFPSLPGLALLAAGGLADLRNATRMTAGGRGARVALAALAIVFVFGFVRFHGRTAILAYESLTGTRTKFSRRWGMTKRQDEAEIVSRFVSERLKPGEPLYIWGYAHDVFWQTGCAPASRYLTPYFIDGRFPDSESVPSTADSSYWRHTRSKLVEDLSRNRPRLILEVYGGLRDLPYPEITEFIRANYRDAGNAGPDPARPFHVLELASTARRSDP
jgi:4-amino-4-deoxy-L-arabinose transferase-like glycosyltransferase